MLDRTAVLPAGRLSRLWLQAVLCALMAFTSISIDLYLPALPAITRGFASRQGSAELTISGFLVGFSLGQLFWGAISDQVGRKGPLLAGLCIFVVGSLGCATAAGMGQLIGWRCVQAIGASAGIVLARAMVRDVYGQTRAAQMLSLLIGIMAIAPLIGPFVGGQILLYAKWPMLFLLLAAFGACVGAAVLSLPETLPVRSGTDNAWRTYHFLLRQPAIIRSAGTGALFYCGMFAYVAGTPGTYIHFYGVTPQFYGLIYGSSTSAVIVANIVNARIVARSGAQNMLRRGTAIAASAAAVALAVALTGDAGLPELIATYACLTLFAAMVGLIVANSICLAMDASPDHAGAISALSGAAHYGAGVLGSAAVSFLADGTPRPMAFVMTISSVAAWTLSKKSSQS